MGALRRATVLAALALHTTGATILSSFDEAKLLRVDAILVLAGGAPTFHEGLTRLQSATFAVV